MIERALRDERAVSKVVGVTLLVAIVAVLAAVAAVTFTSIGTTESIPSATFEFEFEQNESYSASNFDVSDGTGTNYTAPLDGFTGDMLTITHIGGDRIASEHLTVSVSGPKVKYINQTGALQDYGGAASGEYQSEYTYEQMGFSSDVSATDNTTLVTNFVDYKRNPDPYSPGSMLRNATVRVIYEGDERSAVIDTWEGPGA
ncbi:MULTISPECIES: type IV pilin [Haloarcula]|uniref:type IV pilin n=1 Tax=Haloarcula TaxID=2237 RepID=UPI0023E8D67D|nr:type IV pilin [Halomicroarcula sp. SHR3]